MKFKNLTYAFAITLLLFNCSGGDDDLSPNPDPDPDPTSVTYNGTIKNIINNNCNSCHGSPTSNSAPMSLTTYSQVKSAVETRGLISRINNTANPMPQSGLMSQTNRNLIQQWVDQGFLEN
ncbi:MAG: hypothetical protein K9I95_02675 [Flavobacteriaceae bacterium]|nr:hypothetical protein [Flavobacteriaceae bacterium]